MNETQSEVTQFKKDTAAAALIRPDLKMIALLALGHVCVDTNQGAISAILPYIKNALNLSYTAVGALVLVTNLTSSVIQPLFGYFSDRRARHWMLPASVLCAGIGMGLLGWADSYLITMLLLVMMGLGTASYHPEGYRTAAQVAGSRKATAVSWFSVGGNIGMAMGPPLITFFVVKFGLRGSIGMVIPAVLISLLLFLALAQHNNGVRSDAASAPVKKAEKNRPGAMALLIGVVAIRSWTQLGFVTYIPFYCLEYLKTGPERVASLLFVFLSAGAVGTLIGGPIADRWGVRKQIIGAFLLSIPLGFLFLMTQGAASYIVLALFGAALISTFTTSVVLGQAYLPRNPGMASGMTVGLAVGTGGVAVILFGSIADRFGVPTVLWICAVLPLVAFITSLFLPSIISKSVRSEQPS